MPPPNQPKCPYAEGTKELEEWLSGYDDWAEFRLRDEQ
jgi:hypothetical protein